MIRLLMTWWGALARGDETIGDLFAVVRTAQLLRSAGCEVQVVSRVPYLEIEGAAHIVDAPTDIHPDSIDMLGFACGPLIADSDAFQAMLAHFGDRPKFAVGVSILPDQWRPFDCIVARDGAPESFGDFAFDPAELDKRVEATTAPVVGVCLRGEQQEYGAVACLWRSAHHRAALIAEAWGGSVRSLDTRLLGDIGAAQRIIDEFSACDLIVTTRLHGALLGLAVGRPVIAIDQIAGGGKVASVLRQMGWPLVFSASHSEDEMIAAVARCRHPGIHDDVASARARMSEAVGTIGSRLARAVKELSR